MSFFSNLSKSLGFKSQESSKGHILGASTENKSGPPKTPAAPKSNSVFQVTFVESVMGFQVMKSEDDQRAKITMVNKGLAADLAGVKVGDKVVALDGNPIPTYDVFSGLIGALERPLVIRYSPFTEELLLPLIYQHQFSSRTCTFQTNNKTTISTPCRDGE
jgi:hypothetical protein